MRNASDVLIPISGTLRLCNTRACLVRHVRYRADLNPLVLAWCFVLAVAQLNGETLNLQQAETPGASAQAVTQAEPAKPAVPLPDNALVPGIDPPHRPILLTERATWFVKSTVGLQSLAGGIISAGWGTAFNKPAEYRSTWAGFGKRYGMRLTGVATSNAVEATLGALWDEDPRYVRAPTDRVAVRIKRPIKMAFVAHSSQGTLRPAYARYAGITTSSFASNAWRAESDRSGKDALVRVALGFVGRMAGNAFVEFWPDVRQRLIRRSPQNPSSKP